METSNSSFTIVARPDIATKEIESHIVGKTVETMPERIELSSGEILERTRKAHSRLLAIQIIS